MSLFSDQKIIKLTETASTNDYLEQIQKSSSIPEGTVVITQKQSQGKGMDTNKWDSEPGKNLTLSIYLTPNFIAPCDQFSISTCASLAVYDFIKNYTNQNISIKWPNDIYVNDQKISGILIRHGIEGNQIGHSIIGIGINMNQDKFASWVPNPTSIKNIIDKDVDLNEALAKFLPCFENRYKQLREGVLTEMKQEYLQLMYKRNQFAKYMYLGKKITAKITGIGEYGFLQFEDKKGVVYECDLKEIEYLH
ncbi:MAG: biotin--[acetyl-CoA-carboxylase] ligase [Bacteroidales bacterium]|nr:biotin--[acetyl-CoA-carboxylase] ligase [Bacteroidales bacterium]